MTLVMLQTKQPTAYETYEYSYDENRNVAKVHEGRTIGQFGPGLAQPILKTI